MNDALRAAVFARDKGICSFSGLSVWYLDHGVAPFSQPDWVDHVQPKSKKGSDTLDNLVCASHFYNRKKLNNSSDRQYLFSEGKPTEAFFWTHGELSQQQADLLNGHAALNASDWYFNRAIFNIAVTIYDELDGAQVVRSRSYWLESARKRMSMWKRLTDGDSTSFEQRGLVRYPDAIDVRLMISFAKAPFEKWESIYDKLARLARSNNAVYDRFVRANNGADRLRIIAAAEKRRRATLPLLQVMKRNAVTLSG